MANNSENDCTTKDRSTIEQAFGKVFKKFSKGKSGETSSKTETLLPENPKPKPGATAPLKSMQIAHKSDVGAVRSLDEDSIVVIDYCASYESDRLRKIFAIVADGVGGYSKGEVASYMATKTISEHVMPLFLKKVVDGKEYEEKLQKGFRKANELIMDYALNHPECVNMGTTASAVVIDGKYVYVGHVGDTRAYVTSENGITQITKDHSLVQQLVDEGKITIKEARNHPQKNVITRAIGVGSNLEVDVFSHTLRDKDYVLLCCDGLVNEVEDEEIMRIVLSSNTLQDACDELVDLANERGGRDNISVIAIGPIKIPELGVRPEEDKTQPMAKALEPPARPTSTHSEWCINCGQPIDPSTKLCAHCGAQLEEKTTSKPSDSPPRKDSS
jgi:protein phosphatase